MTTTTLRELLAKATQGEWIADCDGAHHRAVIRCGLTPIAELWMTGQPQAEREATARLIVAMHEALPALLDAAEERDALRARLDAAPVATVGWQIGVGMTLESCRLSSDLIGKRVALVELPAPPVAGGGE